MDFKCSININIIDKGDPRTAGWKSYVMNTEKLVGAIKTGYAFSPGVINPEFFANPYKEDGKLRTKPMEKDILSAQLFGIDIDNDKSVHNKETKKHDKSRLTEEEGYVTFKEVSENEWIKNNALFVYTTPSHKEEWNKFRIVFLLPNEFTDIDSYKNLVEIFIKKFKSDKACRNIDRMFFGSQNAEVVIYDKQLTDEELERVMMQDAQEEEAVQVEEETYQNYHQHRSFEISPEQAEKMLEYIPKQMCYDEWGKVVSAIGNTFDEGTAVRLIENWSPDTTMGTEYKIKHRSAKPQIASVIWLASQNGFDKTLLYGGMTNGFSHKNGTKGKKSGEKLTAEEEKQKQSQVEIVEKYLNEKYKLRYNTMRGYTEFMTGEMKEYEQMTDRDVNEIWRQLQTKKLNVKKTNIEAIIDSNFVEEFHPLKHYFEHLPEWDGDDHIGNFIKLFVVEEGQEARWNLYFTKWIVAVVACATERGINHTCPVLVGGQSIGKTTIINKLVPKQLAEYYATGAINPKDKDSKLLVVENFLINLDELETSTNDEIGHLKSLMTIEQQTIRRPFGRRAETLRRRASFIGSVNKGEFLSDLTGTRRFLAVDVKEIKFQDSFNIDKLYSHARHLLRSDFQHWFDKEETLLINESNDKYMFFLPEEELIVQHFKPFDPDDKTTVGPTGIVEEKLMTATDIFDYLQLKHPSTKLSLRKLGQVLKNAGFVQKSRRVNGGKTMRIYSVTKLEAGDFSLSGKNENEKLF